MTHPPASPVDAHPAVRKVPAALVDALRARFGDRCSTVVSVDTNPCGFKIMRLKLSDVAW